MPDMGDGGGFVRAVDAVGERWTLLILRDAFAGVRRLDDFAEHLDIPRTVLVSRLRRLVAAELLVQDGNAYLLTAAGRDLWPAIDALTRWGDRLQDGVRAPLQ